MTNENDNIVTEDWLEPPTPNFDLHVACKAKQDYLLRVIDRCYAEFDFGKWGINPWAEDSDCEDRFG